MIYNDRQWRAFFKAIGEPDRMERDARFASQGARLENIDEVYGYLADTLLTRTTREWLEILEAADLPVAPLNEVDDLIADPHLKQVGLLRSVQHPSEGEIVSIGNPTEWSETPPGVFKHAPRIGEHTAEILREFGFARMQINELIESRTVFDTSNEASSYSAPPSG